MRPDQAMACAPRFARTGVTKGSRGMFDYGSYEPLQLRVRGDQRYPSVSSSEPNERTIASYGAEVVARGAIDDQGDQVFRGSGTSLAVQELFHVTGTVTLTDRRVIGSGARGASTLGAVEIRSGTQLLFSVDLTQVYEVAIMRSADRRGRLQETGIRLTLPTHHAGVAIRVVGRLDTRKSTVTMTEAAQTIVSTACAARLSVALDEDERRRVNAVMAGDWASDGNDIVAYIRHPDDVPEEWIEDGH